MTVIFYITVMQNCTHLICASVVDVGFWGGTSTIEGDWVKASNVELTIMSSLKQR